MHRPQDSSGEASVSVDTSTPSVARVYDLMLGGKDNFSVDRAMYEQLVEVAPELPQVLRGNRDWLARVVRWLAGQGVAQFIDCGSGLPTAENTHEVAQRVNPDATVVYVDNDPAVSAFDRALLEDNDRTHFVAADLTHPEDVRADPVVVGNLDLTRPVAVIHCLTLQLIEDTTEARRVATGYIEALAPGSFVAISHPLRPEPDDRLAGYAAELEARYKSFSSGQQRTHAEITALFDGLDLVEPGVVPLHEWWPTGPRLSPAPDAAHLVVGGVGRKP